MTLEQGARQGLTESMRPPISSAGSPLVPASRGTVATTEQQRQGPTQDKAGGARGDPGTAPWPQQATHPALLHTGRQVQVLTFNN